MRQGCKLIDLDDGITGIMCGGEPLDHECNDDAVVYATIDGKQHFFENSKEGENWYEDNYKSVISMSVACSVCHRAAIDNAMWLDF